MKVLKHNKHRNTGILFEILTRRFVTEAMDKTSTNSQSIIRKYFGNGTELHKELELYQILTEINSNIKDPNRLIDLVLKTYSETIDSNKLLFEKYNLVGAIKKVYDETEFFSQRIPNYKVLASIYKLLEYPTKDNPSNHLECREIVMEHISTVPVESPLTEAQEYWKNQDKDIRKLAFKILIEKFNKKYEVLNENQRMLLKKYVTEDIGSNGFKDFIYGEVDKVRSYISKKSRTFDEKSVTKIKLDEVVKLLDGVIGSKTIKTEHVSALLKYYELMELIK